MPALGMAQETGKVLRWLKAEGDEVAKGEPLMEVETDKVTVEIEAPTDGLLAGLRAAEGADVPVGEAVAVILAPGEALPENGSSPAPEQAPAAAAPVAAADRRGSQARRAPPPRLPEGAPPCRRAGDRPGRARRGQRPGRRRRRGRHPRLAGSRAGQPPPWADRQPLSRIWSIMAERTAQSWASAPHFYLLREVDAGRLASWRSVARDRLGRDVSVTDLLVRATAAALARHPQANAAWDDGSIRLNDEVNVGIAVAVEDGLVVPVVHGADRLGLGEIAARREDVVSRAREGALRPDDLERGTFTISNLGMYGVDAFNAVVNAPQAAILAVGRIVERVVPVDGSPGVRPMMALTLSCDHRVIDGARAAQFLSELAALIEEPAGLAD